MTAEQHEEIYMADLEAGAYVSDETWSATIQMKWRLTEEALVGSWEISPEDPAS